MGDIIPYLRREWKWVFEGLVVEKGMPRRARRIWDSGAADFMAEGGGRGRDGRAGKFGRIGRFGRLGKCGKFGMLRKVPRRLVFYVGRMGLGG